jgi:hypothetical protein
MYTLTDEAKFLKISKIITEKFGNSFDNFGVIDRYDLMNFGCDVLKAFTKDDFVEDQVTDFVDKEKAWKR